MENYEVMDEVMEVENDEVTEYENEDIVEYEEQSNGGKGLAAVVIGGALALTGLAIVGVKKLKSKKADQPKKQKTKLKLVRVPVEEAVEEIPAEAVEVVEEN